MISKTLARKYMQQAREQAKEIILTEGQVDWVKDKVAQVETWVDTAKTAFINLIGRVKALEDKADIAQSKFKEIEDRLDKLEGK